MRKRSNIIISEPCDELLKLQQRGYCVLAELTHLKGLSEEEVAEALCKEEAVVQYHNVCIDSNALPEEYFSRIWYRHCKKPVVIAQTNRILIRESIEEDGDAFFELYQDAACEKYLEHPPVEGQQPVAYRHYIREYIGHQYPFFEYGMWTVLDCQSGKVIGRAGLENTTLSDGTEGISLGYAILPQYRGRGYAYEAAMEILKYCRACEYTDRIILKIHPDNVHSRKIYEKLKQNMDIHLELEDVHT